MLYLPPGPLRVENIYVSTLCVDPVLRESTPKNPEERYRHTVVLNFGEELVTRTLYG